MKKETTTKKTNGKKLDYFRYRFLWRHGIYQHLWHN